MAMTRLGRANLGPLPAMARSSGTSGSGSRVNKDPVSSLGPKSRRLVFAYISIHFRYVKLLLLQLQGFCYVNGCKWSVQSSSISSEDGQNGLTSHVEPALSEGRHVPCLLALVLVIESHGTPCAQERTVWHCLFTAPDD